MSKVKVAYIPEDDQRELPDCLYCTVELTEEDGSFDAFGTDGELMTVTQSAYEATLMAAEHGGKSYMDQLTREEKSEIEETAIYNYE